MSENEDPRARAEAPPARPRLAAHVHARKHTTDRGERVILFDAREARTLALEAREWSIVRAADGTRDAEGIALAASLDGVRVDAPSVRSFVSALYEAGLLAPEGELAPVLAEGSATRRALDDRPLDVLANYAARCDGRGQCCRMYTTVLFSPEETARARAHCPDVLDGGRFPERVFLPMMGSTHPYSSVAQRDGGCSYLDARGLCAVHAAGGLRAKPAGCQMFPAYFTDDGARVRVSASPECACVLASADPDERWDEARAPAGSLLVDATARTRDDLPPEAKIDVVPVLVRVSHKAASPSPRAAVVTLLDALASRVETVTDVPTYLCRVARAYDRGAPEAWDEPLEGPLDAGPWFEALAREAERRERENAAWRSHDDLARRAVRVVALAARACAGDPARSVCAPDGGSPFAAHERFVVRAAAHGLRYALDERVPVAHALRAAAVAQWIARAAPEAAQRIEREELDGAQGSGRHAEQDFAIARTYPLALVEAVLRGHGLGAYARALVDRAI